MGVAESISAVSVAGTVTGLSYTQATAQQRAANGGSGGGGGGGGSGAGADGSSRGAFPASSSSGFDGVGGGGGDERKGAIPMSVSAQGRAGRQAAVHQNRMRDRSRRSAEAESVQRDAASRRPPDHESTREIPEPCKPRYKSNPNRRKRRGAIKHDPTIGAQGTSASPSSQMPVVDNPTPSHTSSNDLPPDSGAPVGVPSRGPRHKSNPNRRKRGPKQTGRDVPNNAPESSGGLTMKPAR